VEVTHGRLQAGAVHGLLDGTGVGTLLKTMGCIAVAKFVRKNGDAELAPSVFDGTLHVDLVHSIAHQRVGVRIPARRVGREKPGPPPTKLVFRTLLRQQVRQQKRHTILLILRSDDPGVLDLRSHLGQQRRGPSHQSVFPAFCTTNTEGALFEACILDAQVQGFTDPEPTTIKHASDQIGRVTAFIVDSLQKRLGFRHRGGMALMNRSFGPQGVNIGEWVSKHLLVKVKESVEGLALGAGGYVLAGRQDREELLHLFLAGEDCRYVAQRKDVAPEPKQIGLFRG